MKAASISELKQELMNLPAKEVIELCIRLTKYKKENKELLTYLLFEAYDQEAYISNVKEEINQEFIDLPKSSPYQNKKSLRKILRAISKYSKHTASKQAEVEMLLHFCQKVKDSGIRIYKSAALTNLYTQQLKKINILFESLHEDLVFEYSRQLQALT
jgi:3-dehydroquinate dehydratase